jgi:hypothetical protein
MYTAESLSDVGNFSIAARHESTCKKLLMSSEVRGSLLCMGLIR